MAEWNLQDILEQRLEKTHIKDLLSKGVDKIRVINESAFGKLLNELSGPQSAKQPPRRLLERVQQLERELALARQKQSNPHQSRDSRLLEQETKKRIRLEQEARVFKEDRDQMLRLKTELERKCGRLREANRDLRHQVERAEIEIQRLKASSTAKLRAAHAKLQTVQTTAHKARKAAAEAAARAAAPAAQAASPAAQERPPATPEPAVRKLAPRPLSRSSSQAMLKALAQESAEAQAPAAQKPRAPEPVQQEAAPAAAVQPVEAAKAVPAAPAKEQAAQAAAPAKKTAAPTQRQGFGLAMPAGRKSARPQPAPVLAGASRPAPRIPSFGFGPSSFQGTGK